MPGKTFMGSLIVDDTRTWVPFLELSFIEPPETATPAETAKTRDQADDETVLSVVAEIAAAGVQPAVRTVRAKTAGIGKRMGRQRAGLARARRPTHRT